MTNTSHRLDDTASYQAYDPKGLVGLVESFADHAREAVNLTENLENLDQFRGANRIVCLGMGGSAIGSELAGSLTDFEGTVPVTVVRDYTLPAYVNADTFVIAASYSGNTEETIEAFDAATQVTKQILVITAGGRLEQRAKAHQLPCVQLPKGLPPRASVMYFFVGLVHLFERTGYLAGSHPIDEMVAVLEQGRERSGRAAPTSTNPAKQLAEQLVGELPIIVGAEHLGAVTTRWKNELNENGKHLAYPDRVPELLHNTLLGLEFPTALKPSIRFIFLRSGLYHARNQKRFELFAPLVRQQSYRLTELTFEDPTRIGQMLQAVQFGSFVSAYLGVLHERDPYDFRQIEAFKAALGEPKA